MSKTVWNNPDLVRMIYGFGSEHRERMKPVLEDLIIDLSGFVYNMETDRIDRTEHQYLMQEFSYEEKKMFKDYFDHCRCCSRHSHYKNRPKATIPVPESRVKECDCRCRELSRRLGRLRVYHEKLWEIEAEYGPVHF
jgi:hypothetical protein